MSYVQEAHVPVTRMQAAGRRSIVLSARAALALLLLLAFLHGALYALFLPPWGLIDEAQHFHYIQYIAEQQALPVAGELYLSDEIVDSLFATRRWQTFHWTPPAAHDPQLMGLEGHSYEAYQPPLFYLLMTPLYWAFPQDMLVKVYGLRVMVVLLSLIPVWAIYHAARLLLPQFPQLPFWAGLLFVAIPERAIATSRINNDVLLELLAAIFVMLLTHAAFAGLTGRRAFLLGLLLGLAVWVKISAGLLGIPLLLLLWLHRHERGWMRKAGWIMVAAAPLGGALALRNLWLYGDLTGFGAFDQLHRLAPVDPSLGGFVRVLVSLPNHLWLVWWKGSEVGGNWLLTLFYLLMALVVAGAWGTLLLHFRYRRKPHDARRVVALLYALTVLIYAFAVVGSYYEEMVPVIQGRFLLPAMLPFVLLLVWGLWLTGRGAVILLMVVILLWGMGLFSLFGNLVPYFYYWSDVVQGTMPVASSILWQGILWTYQRALFDKPSFLAPLLLVLPICYAAALLFTFIVILRAMPPLRRRQAEEDHLPVHP